MNIPDRVLVQAHLSAYAQPQISEDEALRLGEAIHLTLKQQDAVMVAHYYCDPWIQRLAEETGGIVSDSLEMARFGRDHPASTLLVAGVKFMGETAKILSPNKRVLMPTLEATCSLDLGCPIQDFEDLCDQHPDRVVVVYANTSATVKARADWVVTSSCAVEIVDALDAEGKKILWAPDQHLGRYIQLKTKADMLLWAGSCIVHEEFKAKQLQDLKRVYRNAAILVHPESPTAVIELADVVGSTSQLIQAAKNLPNPEFIVATDRGIFYKMQQAAPNKVLIEAPTAGSGATCRSCAHCPWMAMNTLERTLDVLQTGHQAIEVDDHLIERALVPLNRMLAFTQKSR